MNKKHWLIFGLVLLLTLPASIPAFGWSKIVSFGDSLSDNGIADGYGHPGAPASNGPVWLDYLAASMKDVELEDRAIGGAQTSGPVHPTFGDIGMTEQVNTYISQLPAEADLSGVLFTIWIGGNDFLNMGTQNPGIVIMTAISRIDACIQQLVAAGAEDILIMNLPDLGLAPRFNVDPFASAQASQLSAAFNTHLKQLMCNLNGTNPEVKFYMADTYKLLQYAVENGELLGFSNVYGQCTVDGALPGCEGYVFFDSIHPTTATHQYLAALAVGQIKHGQVSKELKNLLQDLNPLHPRMPFIVDCGY
jgi:outer membrane lipase/esterase